MGKSGAKWRKMFIFAHENKTTKKTMLRFLGNIEARTDVKGRVFLPATFRKMLQAEGCETLILRKDIHQKCLVLYPQRVWDESVDALRSRINMFDDTGKMVYRQYLMEAEVVTLDGNGRILIPGHFLRDAGIDQAVRFIGMTDTIEIWAAEMVEQPFLPQEDFSAKLKAIMKAPQQI